MDRSRLRRRAISWAKWAVALAILFFLVRHLVRNVDQLRQVELTLRYPQLVGALGVLVAYFVGRVFAWDLLTRRMGVAIPLRKAFPAWCYSLAGKYVPGKVFIYLTRMAFYVEQGQSKSRFTLCFFLETVFGLLALVLTALLAFLWHGLERIPQFSYMLFALLGLFLLCLHPRLLSRAINAARALLHKPPIELPLGYGDMLRFVLIFTANWAVACVGCFLLVNAVYPVPASDALYVAGAFSLASLGGILMVLAPSGLGVREGILAVLLAQVAPSSVAVVLSLAARLWFTAGECVIIAAVFIAGRINPGSVPRPPDIPPQQPGTPDP